MEINIRNVNEALYVGRQAIKSSGVEFPSRNGPMLEMSTPVTTIYNKPEERVLFFDKRDANPFFHFFECLWMIQGRNDLPFVNQFIKQIAEYSDDGKTLNGSAYGWRWRHHFRKPFGPDADTQQGKLYDQIKQAVKMLKENPEDRRVVLQMWDANEDLGSDSKDIPCNTCIYLKLRDGVLDITVSNRSNDMVWGAYGANAVHFSFLLEYLCMHLKCKMGRYYQVSNSFHVYIENEVWQRIAEDDNLIFDPYEAGEVKPYYFMAEEPDAFDSDLNLFFKNATSEKFQTQFFQNVVTPMYLAHVLYKQKNTDAAIKLCTEIRAEDWKRACIEWLERRKANAAAKNNES